jgi:hypothetical protein
MGRCVGKSGMKDKIVITLEQYYEAKVAQHKLNIDIMMSNPRVIPEHENFTEAIDKELSELANAHDKLQALKEYF